MTLRRYLTKKLGNKKTITACLKFMLQKSFYSKSFREFWKHWNPLWSYFLTYYSYKPLKTKLPKSIAVLLTFGISGALHDVFVMLLLQKFYYLFTMIFLVFGALVLVESSLKISITSSSKVLRPIYHSTIIILCTVTIKYFYS